MAHHAHLLKRIKHKYSHADTYISAYSTLTHS